MSANTVRLAPRAIAKISIERSKNFFMANLHLQKPNDSVNGRESECVGETDESSEILMAPGQLSSGVYHNLDEPPHKTRASKVSEIHQRRWESLRNRVSIRSFLLLAGPKVGSVLKTTFHDLAA